MQACRLELGEEASACLCAAIEEGIATTDIGLESVKLSDAVAQMDGVGLAGTTTIFVVFSG